MFKKYCQVYENNKRSEIFFAKRTEMSLVIFIVLDYNTIKLEHVIGLDNSVFAKMLDDTANPDDLQSTFEFFEKEFPELLDHDFTANEVKHGVVHHIEIKQGETPCWSKARQISQEKEETGKKAWME